MGRISGRARARRSARSAALLVTAALAAACAKPAALEESATPDPVRVRIGVIDAAMLDSTRRGAPGKLPERTEQIVDLFWQVGCLGEQLEVTLPDYKRNPDVICSLPGRTRHTIVVAGHLDGETDESGTPENWAGVALLPSLYRALRVESREHSFLFVAFGESAPRQGFRSYLARLDDARRDEVRAFVDLQDVAPSVLWSSSEDPVLRRDLVAVARAIGRPLETLRFFVPRHAEPSRSVKIPTITLGGTHETQAVEEPPEVSAPGPGSSETYHGTARVIALYLGYLDETLRLRSAPPETQPPTTSAATPPGGG